MDYTLPKNLYNKITTSAMDTRDNKDHKDLSSIPVYDTPFPTPVYNTPFPTPVYNTPFPTTV